MRREKITPQLKNSARENAMNNEIRNESQALPESIRCVGADDLTLSLFENQYPVQPMGVSYNSYLILDEKVAVMDSVDARAALYSSGVRMLFNLSYSVCQPAFSESKASARPPQPTY